MKKTVLVLSIFIALLLIEPLAQEEIRADTPETYVNVYSPHPSPHIYSNSTVEITIDYAVPVDWIEIYSFSYSLDGNGNQYLDSYRSNQLGIVYYRIRGIIENLANGNHSLEVSAYFVNGAVTKAVYNGTFTVDKTFNPTPTPNEASMSTLAPRKVKSVNFAFEPTVFGVTGGMIAVTVIASIVLLYSEKRN